MIGHIQSVFSVSDRGGGVGLLGCCWGHAQLGPVFNDHALDLFRLLVLGRGVSVGGSCLLDTSLLAFLLSLGVAWVLLVTLPLFGVAIRGLG